jgi:hypothetical protein
MNTNQVLSLIRSLSDFPAPLKPYRSLTEWAVLLEILSPEEIAFTTEDSRLLVEYWKNQVSTSPYKDFQVLSTVGQTIQHKPVHLRMLVEEESAPPSLTPFYEFAFTHTVNVGGQIVGEVTPNSREFGLYVNTGRVRWSIPNPAQWVEDIWSKILQAVTIAPNAKNLKINGVPIIQHQVPEFVLDFLCEIEKKYDSVDIAFIPISSDEDGEMELFPSGLVPLVYELEERGITDSYYATVSLNTSFWAEVASSFLVSQS